MAFHASQQANMQISTGIPRPRPLALCILLAKEVPDSARAPSGYHEYRHTKPSLSIRATTHAQLVEG